jgi:hypothetical protein
LGCFAKAKHSAKIRKDADFCAKNQAIRSNAYGGYAIRIPLLSFALLKIRIHADFQHGFWQSQTPHLVTSRHPWRRIHAVLPNRIAVWAWSCAQRNSISKNGFAVFTPPSMA